MRKEKTTTKKNAWRYDLEADVRETGYDSIQLGRLAQDQNAWWNHAPGGVTKAMIDLIEFVLFQFAATHKKLRILYLRLRSDAFLWTTSENKIKIKELLLHGISTVKGH